MIFLYLFLATPHYIISTSLLDHLPLTSALALDRPTRPCYASNEKRLVDT